MKENRKYKRIIKTNVLQEILVFISGTSHIRFAGDFREFKYDIKFLIFEEKHDILTYKSLTELKRIN